MGSFDPCHRRRGAQTLSDLRWICAACGEAFRHQCSATPDARPALDAQIAHGSEISSKNLTKDGRQGYNQNYPQEFLVFWNIYPRHRDKRKALKAWRNAIRRAAIEDINDGARRYRKDPNRREEFTKYAEGWLNGDGWEDEPLPARNGNGALPSVPIFDGLAWAICIVCGEELHASELLAGRCVTCRSAVSGKAEPR